MSPQSVMARQISGFKTKQLNWKCFLHLVPKVTEDITYDEKWQ